MLNVMMDCPTRWNSLEAMVSRFLVLYKSIQKALINNDDSVEFEEEELELLESLVKAIQLIKVGVDSLNRRDCTLVRADDIIRFVM